MVAPADSFSTALRQFQNGQFAEAQRQLSDLVQADPQQAEAWHLLGLIEYQKANFAEAVKHFHRAVQIDGRSAKYLTNLGSTWHALGETREATGCFERAIAADPRHARIANVSRHHSTSARGLGYCRGLFASRVARRAAVVAGRGSIWETSFVNEASSIRPPSSTSWLCRSNRTVPKLC